MHETCSTTTMLVTREQNSKFVFQQEVLALNSLRGILTRFADFGRFQVFCDHSQRHYQCSAKLRYIFVAVCLVKSN